MPAALAYKMFKAKTAYPLHKAIQTKREDVLFLYLVENDSQVCKVYLAVVLSVIIRIFVPATSQAIRYDVFVPVTGQAESDGR